MAEIRMVVGLGNPGEKYAQTRHNIGFKVVDALAKVLGITAGSRKFGARLGSGRYADKKLILLKPCRFMNRSGESVASAVAFYKVAPAELIVIVDDMSLEPGRLRLRPAGSAGGHNGLADVIEKLGTEKFCRLRIGIGRCADGEPVGYVLGAISRGEKPIVADAVDRAAKAVLCWVERGIDAAMNEFNPDSEN